MNFRIDELAWKECAEQGISMHVLTSKELKQLKREIKMRLRGELFCDGVLFNIEIYCRGKNKRKNKRKKTHL